MSINEYWTKELGTKLIAAEFMQVMRELDLAHVSCRSVYCTWNNAYASGMCDEGSRLAR